MIPLGHQTSSQLICARYLAFELCTLTTATDTVHCCKTCIYNCRTIVSGSLQPTTTDPWLYTAAMSHIHIFTTPWWFLEEVAASCAVAD